MVDGDVPAGLALCRAAGWNQTIEDWDLFLKLSPKGCCVAVDDEGQVRGTAATVQVSKYLKNLVMVVCLKEFVVKYKVLFECAPKNGCSGFNRLAAGPWLF